MGDLKLRPNRALKYFLKNQRCSEEIKSGHLLFKWVKKNERLLTNPKVVLMKCFLPIHPIFVLICHLSFASALILRSFATISIACLTFPFLDYITIWQMEIEETNLLKSS